MFVLNFQVAIPKADHLFGLHLKAISSTFVSVQVSEFIYLDTS